MGSHNVGKSSLIQRYCNGKFKEKNVTKTERCEFFMKDKIKIAKKIDPTCYLRHMQFGCV